MTSSNRPSPRLRSSWFARTPGDEEIDVPVVVVVGGGRAHGIPDRPHAGGVGHVREAELPSLR